MQNVHNILKYTCYFVDKPSTSMNGATDPADKL